MTAEKVLVKVEQALRERSRREENAKREAMSQRTARESAETHRAREREAWSTRCYEAEAGAVRLRAALELANARLLGAGLEAVQP